MVSIADFRGCWPWCYFLLVDLHFLWHKIKCRVCHPQRLLLPGECPRPGEDQAGHQQEWASVCHEGWSAGAGRDPSVRPTLLITVTALFMLQELGWSSSSACQQLNPWPFTHEQYSMLLLFWGHINSASHLLNSMLRFRSSVFALYCNEPPISAQLLAFLRVFCMMEGKTRHNADQCSLFGECWPW